MYINAASSISHQPTFGNPGFSTLLTELQFPSAIINPDYGKFIPVMELRRMSDVLKMAITCAFDSMVQAGIKEPQAIIVGTCMGCCKHTRNFLDKIMAAKGGLISPTSFIVSTHNTIAGQISLLLGNHNYNITHTQNSLSFEQALMDAVLCLKEGYENVLVGAADENENELHNLNERLHIHTDQSCGASFFILSDEEKGKSDIKLVDVESFGLIANISTIIIKFLESNTLVPDDVDLILYSSCEDETINELSSLFGENKLFDFLRITGIYYTNSALAMHYGLDILAHPSHPKFGAGIKRILVCNHLIPGNLGLILLESKNG